METAFGLCRFLTHLEYAIMRLVTAQPEAKQEQGGQQASQEHQKQQQKEGDHDRLSRK